MPKVTIIGAGSLGFSRKLMIDILSYPELSDTQFSLMDVEPKRLEYAGKIADRIMQEGGYDKASWTATLDRREALKGADYVIVAILVGGYEAIELDVDIPMKYGVDQSISDTIGPGGVFRALRTIPQINGMCEDVVDICPDALILNYTNPMAILSWAVFDGVPEAKYIGLCHSVQGTANQWANRLDIPIAECNYQVAGTNHLAWFLKFEHKGEDLLPKIREKAVDPAVWKGDTTRCEYVKHFSHPVTESSGHNSEYAPWWRKNKKALARYCPDQPWNGRHAYIKELYDRPDWQDRMAKMASGETPMDLSRSHEYGSRIVHASWTNQPTLVYGSVPNTGLITNLPNGCAVEVPCYIDGNGIQPQFIGALPPQCAALNRMNINVQELTVRAALDTDPEAAFHAIAYDPLTAAVLTLDEIRDMVAEMFEAEAKFIPQFDGKALQRKVQLWSLNTPEDVEVHVDPGEAE